jgi:hypothetical protein
MHGPLNVKFEVPWYYKLNQNNFNQKYTFDQLCFSSSIRSISTDASMCTVGRLFSCANSVRTLYTSVSQTPGRGPVPGPDITYTEPREVLLEFVSLVL